MKIKLFIFSGTGNTRFIAGKMKDKFEEKFIQCEVVEIDKNTNDFQINEEEIIGFGYPVYDMKPPSIFLDFINKINIKEKTINSFVFSTYTSYPLDSNSHLIKHLQNKNFKIIDQINFKCPGASAYLYSNPKNILIKSSTIFENNIDNKIKNFIDNLDFNSDKFIDPQFNKINKMHQKFSKWFYGLLFYRNLKIDSNCKSCGLCYKQCPSGNIVEYEGEIIIKSSNNCLACLRCVQQCPSKSINFTSTSRKGNYDLEIIKKMFEQSYNNKVK